MNIFGHRCDDASFMRGLALRSDGWFVVASGPDTRVEPEGVAELVRAVDTLPASGGTRVVVFAEPRPKRPTSHLVEPLRSVRSAGTPLFGNGPIPSDAEGLGGLGSRGTGHP